MPFSLAVNILYPLRQLLPGALRKPARKAYLKALSGPLQTLNTELVAAYNQRVAALEPTGQTIQLERALNLAFGGTWNPTGPGYVPPIHIVNSTITGPFFLPENDAAGPFLLKENDAASPFLLPENSNTAVSGANFIVRIPAAAGYTAAQIQQMRTLISAYAVVGRVFTIVTY